MLNLEHFSINRIKDGHSEKSYFLCSFGESPPHRSFHSGIINRRKFGSCLQVTRLHSTSQSKNQLHFKVV